MKPKIVIRADGGTSIGMGHVMRCIALADMLKDHFIISFAIQAPVESVIRSIHSVTQTILHLPVNDDFESDANSFAEFLEPSDIVVLDGYNFKSSYQQKIKSRGCKLVVVDDLHAWHHFADAIINHAAGISEEDYSKEKHTLLFAGPDYALLRKPFLNRPGERKKISSIKKAFISMGAADIGNLTRKFAEALLEIPETEEIHLMLGAINPNLAGIDELISQNSKVHIQKHFEIPAEKLAALLESCDIAFCPASSISMECSAIGIGLFSGFTADNQNGILAGLKNFNSVVDLGDLNVISKDGIIAAVKKTTAHQLSELCENQKKLVDGRSPERILKIFRSLYEEKIRFRFAGQADAELYYRWTNDPEVRNNSYNQNAVAFEDHLKWFNKKLLLPTCSLYLFVNEKDIPVGQVRIEKGEKETVVGISVDNDFRGKGLASKMLTAASADYLEKHPAENINAYIKLENQSSYHSFLKAGYGSEKIVTEQGFKSYKLVKKTAGND